MRDYTKVSPQFWLGATGRALRGHVEAQLVAAYLLSNPHANMIGLYYLPTMFIAHETGLPIEGASKGLARCIEVGFCGYDRDAEVVWVYEMARFQISDQLKPEDKRCAGVRNDYNTLPQNAFLSGFFDKYAPKFHLMDRRETASPTEGASKPHRSQEQEQEQEQEHVVSKDADASLAPVLELVGVPEPTPKNPTPVSNGVTPRARASVGKGAAVWEAYSAAYQERYRVAPVRNAKVNGQLARFVERVPAEEAPAIAAWFVRSSRALYATARHPVDLLLRDAEAIRTDWATGTQRSETSGRLADRTQHTGAVFAELIEEGRRAAK